MTANEIHIPVGTAVNVVGTTADVIHSFWVPQLNRKIDLIPGRDEPRAARGRPRRAGSAASARSSAASSTPTWRVLVIAEPPARFRAWLANQEAPARAPTTGEERLGAHVFRTQACAGCHTIRGTPARGTIGPDLTHLASRGTLAALTLPNTPPVLRSWITDPDHAKPGVKMPALPLTGSQLDALTAYLGSLR